MDEVVAFSAQWWTEPLGNWMAWTRATIAFFLFILLAIASMGVLEIINPGGAPRHGILSLDTTRGDRLFISLLGSAFILIGWLFFFGTPLWGGLIVTLFWEIGRAHV